MVELRAAARHLQLRVQDAHHHPRRPCVELACRVGSRTSRGSPAPLMMYHHQPRAPRGGSRLRKHRGAGRLLRRSSKHFSWVASWRARKRCRWLRSRSGTRLGCLGELCRRDNPGWAARSHPLYAHKTGRVGERADRSTRTSPGCHSCRGPRGANPTSDRREPRRKRPCCRNMGCAQARMRPPTADPRCSARRRGRSG